MSFNLENDCSAVATVTGIVRNSRQAVIISEKLLLDKQLSNKIKWWRACDLEEVGVEFLVFKSAFSSSSRFVVFLRKNKPAGEEFSKDAKRTGIGYLALSLGFCFRVIAFSRSFRCCFELLNRFMAPKSIKKCIALRETAITQMNELKKAFMNEYLDLGHMQLLTNGNSSDGYYIPHHCVIKADSPSTKLRVVFDASCPSSEGKSLNDSLFVGPKLQKDILTILSRFRVHPIVFTAHIRQMYRQILILPEHRKFQKILWRNFPQEPVQEYRLNTVTYGVSFSPFLAIRTLGELASLEKTQFPLASEVLANDVYIDDIITGCSSIAEAHNLRDELIDLFSTAGFELRKWSSNDPTVLNKNPLSHQLDQALAFNSESEFFVKVLGLQWIPRSFSYSIQPFNRPCSKRSLLSELARIFDSIGFLAPLTFYAKRLIQYLWTLKLSWDDSPPDDIISSWTQFCSELPQLATLQIPRKIIVEKVRLCTLHGFCDASESGYAAVDLRSVSVTHAIEIRLICAKSKVAPLKKISIPRLELCAAVLLAKLIDYTLTTFKGVIEIEQVYAWSDSTITLSWIQSPPHLWKVFVSNRVALIQSLAPTATWHHVSSDDNPADCASRGLSPMHLLQHLLWWAGLTWLCNFDLVVGKSEIPDLENDSIIVEEQRKIKVLQTEESFFDRILSTFSSLRKILRIIAVWLRFVKNFKTKTRNFEALSEDEINYALTLLVKHVQQVFASEVKNLESCFKPFRKLALFVDPQGILRVGGRLKHSGLSFDAKHPMLLPRGHRLTELIVEDMHIRYFHPGTQTLHFLLSQRFWILGAKKLISKIISRCLRCWRLNPRSPQPPMGDLPSLRISQIKPFSCVGVDYGGSFKITLGEQILTFEELYTVLTQIESVLNSRPLCPVSADPNDFSVLTPGHFLTLEPFSASPDSDLSSLKINRLTRWQLVQRLHQDFWSRWHQEYLHTLQQRSKWNTSSKSIVPDTLVIVKNECLSPLRWQLGRIVAVHPGTDGVVRVATVRTSQEVGVEFLVFKSASSSSSRFVVFLRKNKPAGEEFSKDAKRGSFTKLDNVPISHRRPASVVNKLIHEKVAS
ncbi:hypothetical protein TcasGA2_TC002178 [Tribolium castaneum]|uniref:DUF5641 domain-containing protein n=1 Tax=Tribolium castaneum TaxID=7070 RepID=D6WY83_TRICA|nr:hypothetical protein TcasGA2_TC002178 [Tribolium castaneum]